MLVVSALSVRFRGASDPLFYDVSFVVNHGDRVALVGPNGVGKSTLLKAILGQQDYQNGSVRFNPSHLRVAYLTQGLDFAQDEGRTVGDVVLPQLATIEAAEARLEQLATEMTKAAENDLGQLMQVYDEALASLELQSASLDEAKAEKLMAGLGLAHVDWQTPVWLLSGGQKTRLGIVAMLVQDPQLLILDEPTNHLDIEALEWLEAWLQDFDGGVLMVSHDRSFIDRTVNRIVALEDGSARVFEGNYRDYVQTLQTEYEKQWAAWRDQEVEIERMKADIRRTMDKATKRENATKNDFQRRLAKKVAKRAKSKEARLDRYLISDDRVEKPKSTWRLKLDFSDLPSPGKDVLRCENLAVGYDFPLLSGLNLSLRAGERIVLLGPNGHGKSTLLKTFIGELAPLDGRVHCGQSVQIGYLAQGQDVLDANSTPLGTIQRVKAMSETDTRNFLHYFLFSGDDALRLVKDLSYGERARLMLARLIAMGANLLVLDEPINHLDVQSREQFEQALSVFPGSVLAVVHDRYFVERFATTIWEIENHTLKIRVQQAILKP